ncbi:MAG: hypothetical protein LBG31_03895 [Prevotellaceae bacterium]|jgi:hypothetical protein|nr:hypothetical protein [Prevotellaceae bacterium]
MYKYPLFLLLLLIAVPALAHRMPQDTATVSRPAARPVSPFYFLPLYHSMIAKPVQLNFSIDPLLTNATYDDVLTQRNLLSVRSMEQEIIGRLREERRQMQINTGIATAVSLFFWGALVEENVRGYINYRNKQRNQPPPPAPTPPRPPEPRRP